MVLSPRREHGCQNWSKNVEETRRTEVKKEDYEKSEFYGENINNSEKPGNGKLRSGAPDERSKDLKNEALA